MQSNAYGMKSTKSMQYDYIMQYAVCFFFGGAIE